MSKSVFEIGNTSFTFFQEPSAYHYIEDKISLPHTHRTVELFIILSGEAAMWGEFGERRVSDKEACIMPPGVIHSTAADECCERLAFPFIYRRTDEKPDAPDTYSAFKKAFSGEMPVVIPFYERMLSDIFECVKNRAPMGKEKMRVVLNLLLLYLYEKLPASPKADKSQAFPKKDDYYEALVYTDNHLWLSMGKLESMESFCKQIGLTPRQASRILHADYGCGWVELRNRFRMQSALFYMKYCGLSIEELTDKLSYASRESFALTFKKYYGIPPGAAEKKIKEEKAE